MDCILSKFADDTELGGANNSRGMRGLAEGSRYSGALGNHQQHDLQDTKVLGTVPGTEQFWTKAQP